MHQAALDTMDPEYYYKKGKHIICHFPPGVPSEVCAFVQGTNGAKGSMVMEKMQDIMNHDCNFCGSTLLEPGNDVHKGGELTINYVFDNGCAKPGETTVCTGLLQVKNRHMARSPLPDHAMPFIPPAPKSPPKALGINREGSAMCEGDCHDCMQKMLDTALMFIDQDGWYKETDEIVCRDFKTTGQVCAFIEGAPGASGLTVLQKLQDILDHGCNQCGATPLQPGNDVSKGGQLKVDYVTTSGCAVRGHTDMCGDDDFHRVKRDTDTLDSVNGLESDTESTDLASGLDFSIDPNEFSSMSPGPVLEKRYGINCDPGAELCKADKSGFSLDALVEASQYLECDRNYEEKEKILCHNPDGHDGPGQLYAWFDGTDGMGSIVQQKLEDLKKHGCGLCGTVPLLPGDDAEKGGQLRVYLKQRGGCASKGPVGAL
jgi:hypothetical protein